MEQLKVKLKRKQVDFLVCCQVLLVQVYQEMCSVKRAGKLVFRAHHLPNFEIQKYCQGEHQFNGFYSKDNLINKMNDGAYVLSLGKQKKFGTNWVAIYVDNGKNIYFDSFDVKSIPKEI